MVARGEALLSPSVTRRLIATFARRPPAAARKGRGMLDSARKLLARPGQKLEESGVSTSSHSESFPSM